MGALNKVLPKVKPNEYIKYPKAQGWQKQQVNADKIKYKFCVG